MEVNYEGDFYKVLPWNIQLAVNISSVLLDPT